MLRKRDPIFWAATAIFVLSLMLNMAFGQQWLLLMVAAYLLRPTLHSLGFARKLVDERQLQIQYRASSVGFAALLIGNAVLILYLMGKNDHTWEMVGGVLMVSLAVRALAGLLLVGDPAVAGQRIVVAVGLLTALFGAMDGGFRGAFVAVLPGLALAGLGLASRKAPRVIAGILFVVTLLLGVQILLLAIRRHGGPNWGTWLTLGILGVPLISAAFCLWRGATADDDLMPAVAASSGGDR
jgi:hypothetical protein